MASLRKRGRVWYYRFTDSDGIKRERKGCSDKRATEEMARAAESEAAKIRAGMVDPRDIALRDHAAHPLAEHIEAFRAHLEAKGSTPNYVALTVNRVRRLAAVVKGARFAEVNPPKATPKTALARFEAALAERLTPARLGDLTADRVQASLRALVGEGLGLASVNHYATAIRMFSRWCWDSGRTREHALRTVKGFNAKEDPRHDRRTIGLEELRHLIETTHRGPVFKGIPGPTRALLYRLAVATGLRYSEIRSIRPESFDWRAEPPTVNVEAGYTKNGQTATLPLPADLAEDLHPFAESASPGSPVFALTDDRGATMLRFDLEVAGIPYRDGGGLVFDFHALRCQLATNADAAGVSPRVVQKMMRHSTLELTGRYTRPRAVDLDEAALALPSLRPKADTPDACILKATGTDDLAHRPVGKAGGPKPAEGEAEKPNASIVSMAEPDHLAHQPVGKAGAGIPTEAGKDRANVVRAGENLAHHLPTTGTVSSRKAPQADATADLGERSAGSHKPSKGRDLPPEDARNRKEMRVGRGRVELPTHGFSVRCSTN